MIVDNHTHGISGTVYRAGCRECRALNRTRSRHYRAASEAHREANRRTRRESYARHRLGLIGEAE